MKKFLSLIILLFSAVLAMAQGEMTFSNMNQVMQSSYINPANIPQHSFSVSIPAISSLYFGVANTGFRYDDFIYPSTTKPNVNVVDYQRMVSSVEKQNYLYNALSLEWFSLRFKVRHWYFSAGITEKFENRFSYPKDLLRLLTEGNYAFAGSEIDLKGMGMHSMYYREHFIGITHVAKHWTWGGRAKYLNGISNIDLNADDFGIRVGTRAEGYTIGASSDITLNYAGIPVDDNGKYTGYSNGFIQSDSGSSGKQSFGASNLFRFSNPGYALDLGASYQFNKKLLFTAFVNNIGFIQWKSNVTNHSITAQQALNGFDIAGKWLRGDTIRSVDIRDTTKSIFQYKKTNESYTTWLIPQIYLGAKYKLFPKTEVSLLGRFEYYYAPRLAGTFSVQQRFGRVFSLIASYTAQLRRYDNIGVGFSLKPGPLQFYMVTDNIMAVVNPNQTNHFNVRLGFNLIFERTRTNEKQPIPE